MNKNIIITFKTKEGEIKENVPFGTLVSNLIYKFNLPLDSILAVRINNDVYSLDEQLTFNATVEPVLYSSRDGVRVYRRSLCFLLAAALKKLYPSSHLLVGHSLGHGFYYSLENGQSIDQELIDNVEKEMHSMVKKEIPILTENISWQEADELFEKLNLEKTRKQLHFACSSTVKINSLEDFSDICFRPLVTSTKILKVFELKKYGEGFLLRFPESTNPNVLTEFIDKPLLFSIYKKYKEWGKRVNVTAAIDLNELVLKKRINDFIEIAETYQQKNISKIASQIIEKETVKVILIAGPSSSGKTTSAKKLALELLAMGYQSRIISLDSYYIGRDKTPLDEEGNPDYECLEALNIDLLNDNLIDLFNGKEVNLPSYDFHTGTSFFDEKNKMVLQEHELLILEGIHGINDKLTCKIPNEFKFKIFLSALTQLNLDDHNLISAEDNRLIRRIVRDANYRNKTAAQTIDMWPSVLRGEKLYINPFQNNADAILNTALDYELPVLRVFAAPLLRQVTPLQKEYGEARRLLGFLENFYTISPSAVPSRSIIREFIGGSSFKY